MDEKENAVPAKKGRYYGDGGLYKNVKVPVRVVEYVIVALIVVLIGSVIFGAATGGYTVTFDSQGGTRVEAQKLEYGDLVTEPVPPTMEGQTFTGWYTDAGCTQPWDFSEPVSDSVTLYASWAEN